jgi:hypothetical protein
MKFAVSVRGVHPSCKSVMLILAWHHNAQTGICNPSQKTISEETCLSEKQVSRCIKTLCDVGAISIISVGKCQRKSYKINIPEAILSGSFEIPETDTVSGYMDMVSGSNGGRKEPVSDTVSSSFGHGVFSVSDTVSDSYIGRKNIDKSVIERKTPQTPHGGQHGFFAQPEIEVENPAVVVPTKTETRKKSDRLDELFELFYKLYPKKPSGPKNSKRSWKRIVTTETLANQIIDNVRERLVKDIKWVEAIASGDKTYICAPEVFLNQERWLGEYTKVGSIKPVGGNGRYDQNYEPDDGGGIQQFIPPPKDTRTPEEKAAEQRQIDIEREAVKKRMLERNMSKDAIPF